MDIDKIDWEQVRRQGHAERPTPRTQNVDKEVSHIVGRKVLANDPRLIKLVVNWEKEKKIGDTETVNHLKNPRKIEELKKVFS